MMLKHPGLTLIGGLGMAVAIAIGAGFFVAAYSFIAPVLPLDGWRSLDGQGGGR